ncbi:NADH-quinone oxidoreductase subunit C [Tundrisphaera sp. TA3]|uniref:NADH-quinone oxidoreductase subunit C n=1 Tax=Tundrisphaera sp. TA3 TaxID=3435775 RepID=UPI003EB7B29B
MTEAATTTDPHAKTMAILSRLLGDGVATATFRDNLRIYVPADRLIEVLRTLRDEGGFGLLSEVGGADYLGYPERPAGSPRFEVHYVLLNYDTTERVILKVGVDDPNPTIPSAVPLWLGADWMEREVFDMYGIRFEGHPDLRRILMPEEFTAYPLRKDYPLRGRGERHNFPRLTRDES